jgi:hypothetical protein
MTFESGMHGWLACSRQEPAATTAKRPPPRRRLHADWLLELGLMIVLAALLPRGDKRK